MTTVTVRKLSWCLVAAAMLVVGYGCDDDKPAAHGPPVQEFVIYRQGLEEQVRLAWKAFDQVSEYRIFRAFESRGSFTLMAQVSDTNWIDTDFPATTASDDLVFYRVAGVHFDGQLTQLSNTVGYYHFQAIAGEPGIGAATPFGLPFIFWQHDERGVPIYDRESFQPSDIIREQATPGDGISGDRIIRQYGGISYRDIYRDNVWVGPLEDSRGMIPGQAYWYVNKSGHPLDIYLMGQIEDRGRYSVLDIQASPVEGGEYAEACSWRISHSVSVSELGFREQGFMGGTFDTSDRIVSQSGDGFAVYLTESNSWFPEGYQVHPGKAYWIVNKHVDHPWTYEYRP